MNYAGTYIVLILIILEYIYIKKQKMEKGYYRGLNPYYTGIHLHFSIVI